MTKFRTYHIICEISYKYDEISRLSGLVIEIPFWAIWGFGGI